MPRDAAAYAVLLAILAGAVLRIGLMFDRERLAQGRVAAVPRWRPR